MLTDTVYNTTRGQPFKNKFQLYYYDRLRRTHTTMPLMVPYSNVIGIIRQSTGTTLLKQMYKAHQRKQENHVICPITVLILK